METSRLILREHRLEDADAVLAYASDSATHRYQDTSPATPEEVARSLARIDAQRAEAPRRLRYELAIVRRADAQVIGWLPLLLDPEPAQGVAQLGWTIGRAHWGQGFATEAVQAILPFAFEMLRLHRVWSQCQAENVASRRVMEKAGMRPEAHLRENAWVKGRWVDTLQYGLLEREWWARQRNTLVIDDTK